MEGELEASGYTEPEAGEEDGAGSESEQPYIYTCIV